jgi:hypothetical protein
MTEAEERQVLCSKCLQVFPESAIHVLPHFNADAGAFVTTYRCDDCWSPSLTETRARLAAAKDAAEIASAAMVFQRHGIFVHEFQRGDPAAVVRDILLRMLDLLDSGTIHLSVGPTRSN